MMKRKAILVLLLAALLMMLAGLALMVRADGGYFDISSVVPTAGEVDVGDELGFSVYVVNSGPVTATDVLVWNPLPAGTTYVSASGGAFPVLGSLMADTVLSAPLEGHAYDARLGTSVPLTEAGDVSGLAWLGDVPPGGMAVPGLILRVNDPGRRDLVDKAFLYDDRELAGTVSGRAWVRPYSHYVPLVASGAAPPAPTTVITVPMMGQPVVMGGNGDTLEAARAGADTLRESQSFYAAVHYPTDYYPFFSVARTYLQFDPARLATISPARVVSVDLVLYPNGNWDECSAVDTLFRAGTWEELDLAAWDALGEILVTFWTTDTASTPYYTVPITGFEALWSHQGKVVMLVDETAVPLPECQTNALKAGFFGFDPASEAPTYLLVTMKDEQDE